VTACTACTTKTPPCWVSGNNCAALFDSVLALISAPGSANNIGMLIAWSHGECAPGDARCNPFAGNNPLATTWESATSGGCWSCKAGGCFVRCYATELDGATAIADTLMNGAYPTILGALRADWTLCQWQCSSAIRAELGVWGTGAGWLGSCPSGGCGGGNPPPPQPASGAGIGLLLAAGVVVGAVVWSRRERVAAVVTTRDDDRRGRGFSR